MGILKNGLFEGYTGKVGNTVTYKLMGKEVVRIIGKNNKPPTVNQLGNRMKMAVAVQFLKPITEFINVGFQVKAQQENKYPHNMAISYNKKFALKGNYPNITMDYTRAMVAAGNLQPVQNAQVEQIAEGLRFSWAANSDMDWPEREDLAMLLAYFPYLDQAIYKIRAAKRYLGTDLLLLDTAHTGQYMETYIAFVAVESKAVSDSVYLGSLNV